ncbi:hypothetical protein [Sphingomonas sp. CARO-RG-8B-R24-01]|uniref:hypothetical protein n=1 Tax=Sphingomonas sp. CARO-RG-8B-R24-01 TaxID=2914831 RepID=UPI001F560C69|nr:hypothetical protein [Sphingomonas sp. CARO-RG-8B-R24-01]
MKQTGTITWPVSDSGGPIEPLVRFVTNPAGAAIANTVGPLRQVVSDAKSDMRRHLVIAESDSMTPGAVIQVQR